MTYSSFFAKKEENASGAIFPLLLGIPQQTSIAAMNR